MDSAATISEPAPASVASSLPCSRCGYDLKGLPAAGACPECGAPIWRSLKGNLLEYGDRHFLLRLARGSAMVEAGVVLLCFVPIASTLVRTSDAATENEAFNVFLTTEFFAAAGLMLFGWFWLTARDPGFIGGDRSQRSRLITLLSTSALSLAVAACGLWFLLMHFDRISTPLYTRALKVIPAALGISLAVQLPASMAYLTHLAARVPDRKLAADATSLRRITLLLVMLIGASLAIELALSLSTSPTAKRASEIAVIPMGIIVLALLLLVMVRCASLIDRTRLATREAYRRALTLPD